MSMNEHELTILVDRAAEGSWNSKAALHGLPEFSLLDRAKQNEIREAALPFIFHGTKALKELGYQKPRLIITTEELTALPPGVVVHERKYEMIWEKQSDGEGGTFWLFPGDNREYKDSDIELPVIVLSEPSAFCEVREP
jgi:hypothetical protein